MAVTTKTDRSLIRAGASSTRYAAVSLIAPTAPPLAERLPVNVAPVLVRSGSMGGQKIVLARRAVERAISQLRPEDRFSVVRHRDRRPPGIDERPRGSEATRPRSVGSR